MCNEVEMYTPEESHALLSEYNIPETRRNTDTEYETEDNLSTGEYHYRRDTLEAYQSTQRTIGVLKMLLEHEEGLAELFRVELSRYDAIPEPEDS